MAKQAIYNLIPIGFQSKEIGMRLVLDWNGIGMRLDSLRIKLALSSESILVMDDTSC